MARKKSQAGHVNHERWLVSYADFITLLFAFFVVMFASSQTDKQKAQQVSDSVSEALKTGGMTHAVHEILGGTVDEKGKGNAQMKGPGGSEPKNIPDRPDRPDRPDPTIAELLPSMTFLSKALESEIKAGKIEVHLEPRGLVVRLPQAAFFPSGDDAVDPGTYEALDKIGKTVRELSNPVRLEGHTDSVPIHTARFRSNWELSAARSIVMLDLLATRSGVPRERMAIAGYADTAPIADNDTPEGRAKNRRVDIVILNQQVAIQKGVSAEPPARPGTLPAKPPPAPPVAPPAVLPAAPKK